MLELGGALSGEARAPGLGAAGGALAAVPLEYSC